MEKQTASKDKVKVVIFCGGRGLRFREETELKPKPLIEIGERPILWHIMKIYSKYGFNDFILPLGYKGHMIRDYFLNYENHNRDITVHLVKPEVARHSEHDEINWKVTMVDTGLNTNTGARLARVCDHIDTDYFMLTYGDGVGDVDINKLLQFHKEHGKIGTVTGVVPPPRFGELCLNGSCVEKYSEKPKNSDSFINGGFFVFDKRIFDYVNDSDSLSFEHQALKNLAGDKELMAYRHEGFWHPMDTYRDWEALNEMWTAGKAPWKIW